MDKRDRAYPRLSILHHWAAREKCCEPPPTADGARGRVRTTLKSTVSSAYGSNDHWDSLGTQLDQIYSWEAPYTALLYTLLHVRARTKVG